MSAPTGRRHSRDERGYAAVMAGIFFAGLMFPICAISVDVARWYVEIQRVQNAADAAATAGVTFLPDNVPAARSRALEVAQDNGYPDSSSTIAVTAEVGAKPTQLRVTIRSTITNTFAGAFNQGLTVIERSAVADFNGPVPLGSPCNAFGNEPPGYNGGSADDSNPFGPRTSVIVAPPGGASCTPNPQFWAAIAGPETGKGSGDAYMTRACDSSASNCPGGVNADFDPLGYFYAVHVGADAVNTSITLQAFDPAWVEVGDLCSGPATSSGVPFRDDENPYAPDGLSRYATGTTGLFCSGDVLNGGNVPITTSFAMREPTTTYDPVQGKPMTSCVRQYGGFTAAQVNSGTLDSRKSTYNPELAKVFRQWTNLCTFTPTKTGDYYLQVRTNVTLGGTKDTSTYGDGAYVGNTAVFTQLGDDPTVKGNGNNRFSLRVKGLKRAAVSITGVEHFSLYANYTGASSTFNLVRVVPAAATKTLNLGFFDMGDATKPGTLQVLPPSDSGLTTMQGCKGVGVTTAALTDCKLTNVGSNYNGKWQYISVQIPSTYTCNSAQAGGCWFTVKASFPDGVPSDTTTWTANIDGDPIRLIE